MYIWNAHIIIRFSEEKNINIWATFPFWTIFHNPVDHNFRIRDRSVCVPGQSNYCATSAQYAPARKFMCTRHLSSAKRKRVASLLHIHIEASRSDITHTPKGGNSILHTSNMPHDVATMQSHLLYIINAHACPIIRKRSRMQTTHYCQ